MAILVVGPLAGGSLARLGMLGLLLQPVGALAMTLPRVPGAFAGLHYPSLDGAMWTIALELRCYLLVVLLGRAGVLERSWWLALLAAVAFAAHWLVSPAVFEAWGHQPLVWTLTMDPSGFTRLAGHFLVGAWWRRVWRDGRVRPAKLGLAGGMLIAGLLTPVLTEPAVAIAGGYLLLTASRTRIGWLRQLGERTDISYGLYLYAWPVMNLLILRWPGIQPGMLSVTTLVLTLPPALASWHLVEAPVLRWVRARTPGRRGVIAAAPLPPAFT
jgi:peptidoglycan/LPS O-acetylase OafA/YrhL